MTNSDQTLHQNIKCISEKIFFFNLTSGHFDYYCEKQQNKKAVPPVGMEELFMSEVVDSRFGPFLDIRWRMVESTDLNKKGWRFITIDCRIFFKDNGTIVLGAHFERSSKISYESVKHCWATVERIILPDEKNIWKRMVCHMRYMFEHCDSLGDEIPNMIRVGPKCFIDQEIMLKRIIEKIVLALDSDDPIYECALIDKEHIDEYKKYDPQPIIDDLTTSINYFIEHGVKPDPRFETFHPENLIDVFDPALDD